MIIAKIRSNTKKKKREARSTFLSNDQRHLGEFLRCIYDFDGDDVSAAAIYRRLRQGGHTKTFVKVGLEELDRMDLIELAQSPGNSEPVFPHYSVRLTATGKLRLSQGAGQSPYNIYGDQINTGPNSSVVSRSSHVNTSLNSSDQSAELLNTLAEKYEPEIVAALRLLDEAVQGLNSQEKTNILLIALQELLEEQPRKDLLRALFEPLQSAVSLGAGITTIITALWN
ncbi:MAG: hypothetical protein ACRDPK_11055 [Carbonactinosporaceae bacterium]